MCGRYYMDDVTYEKIQKIVLNIDRSLNRYTSTGDIHPTEMAPVIVASSDGQLQLTGKKWGYPGKDNKGVIFNARAESVEEKPMFRSGIRYHRAVIPASGFYEWNHQKEKNTFFRKDLDVMYLAGFYDLFGNCNRFVIITTQANLSMKKIHDRMPLVLEKNQIRTWLCETDAAASILRQTPILLEHHADYEQQTLFPIE